jgi:hypothetical protein
MKKKNGTEIKRNRTVAEQKKIKQNLSWKYSNNKDGKGEKRAKKHYYPDELLSPCSRNRSQSKRRDRCFNFNRLTRFKLKRWPTPSFFIF